MFVPIQLSTRPIYPPFSSPSSPSLLCLLLSPSSLSPHLPHSLLVLLIRPPAPHPLASSLLFLLSLTVVPSVSIPCFLSINYHKRGGETHKTNLTLLKMNMYSAVTEAAQGKTWTIIDVGVYIPPPKTALRLR